VVEVTVNGRPLRHVVRHSPDGFEWGYAGSGPADLALSILSDYLDDPDLVERAYQDFKWAFVALWPPEGWRVTGEEIARWFRFHLRVSVPVRDRVYEGRRLHAPDPARRPGPA
jgi:hypothetical protein